MKRRILIVSSILLVLASLIGGLTYAVTSRADKGAEATAVRLEKPARGDLIELVQAPGEIQPRNKVNISARVSARIADLPISEGGKVKAGDVLVKLDATDLEAALRSAEARKAAQQAAIEVAKTRVRAQKSQLKASETVLADLQRDLRRQKELFASRDISESVLDTAQRRFDEQSANLDAARDNLVADEANLIVLQHNLEAAEAEILRARDDLSYTTIKSPIDGILTRLNAKAGELVVTGTMNNAGTIIMEIADFSEMLLMTRVDEADIAHVQAGQNARIHTQAYPDIEFAGTVERVALAQANTGAGQITNVSSANRYFKVEILIHTNGQQLFSGLTADADIETHRHLDMLKVPSQAVLGRAVDDLPSFVRDSNSAIDKRKSQATVVYRAIEGKAVVTPVVVGPSDLTHTIIKAGLSASDTVITGPYKVLESLKHDQKIKDERATTKPTTAPATQVSTK
jgi:HlyD family secretion protein